MENIPLRAYNREIEQLIDDNRSQDALEHCQRVLDQYPRCLDTFRLMGKAYLELHQFDKAEDVFQKVLSFIPDDFTANLGMSLLREKQTNLEGTIWHMERAYEAQPSNTAIQGELRRLYKQRDGIDSPRIRLTRGALVRMYIRGDLIPQAINEIQSILNEDPSRMDIRILQATAYLKAGKKDEALQLCQEILKDLPYCFDANRILFENRSSSIKIEEAQTVQQRLRELDPYFEFTSPEQPDPSKVPEEDVKIEIAEGSGPKTATVDSPQIPSFSVYDVFNQTSSTDSLGMVENTDKQPADAEKAFRNEELPPWMEDIQASSFQTADESGNTGISNGEISFNPTSEFDSGKTMTTEDSFSPNEFPNEKNTPPTQNPDEAASPNPFLPIGGDAIPTAEPGDIPEWLKALASEPPAASSDAVTSPLRVPGETGVLQTGEENLDFLRTFSGESAETKPQPSEPQNAPIESLPGILPPSPFLTSTESTQPVPLEEGGETIQPPSRDIPDWLRSAVEPTTMEPKAEEPMAVEPVAADFRQDFIPEDQPPVQSENKPVALENEFQAPEPESAVTARVEDDELPTPEIEQYLEQLRKDISPGEQPEWLKKENLGNELEALFEDSQKPAPVIPTPEPEPATPDWLSEVKKEEVVPTAQPPISQTPASVPNVPDWLFTPEDADGETAPIQSDSPVTHQPPPDWLAAARPDIFSRDFDQPETEKEAPSIPESFREEVAAPEPQNFASNIVQPPVSEPVVSEPEHPEITLPDMGFLQSQPVIPEPEHPEITLPDMGFLQSQPIDFINADREPLMDNLESPAVPTSEKEVYDFSKAVPAESLPADLAALLREEEESELTTNPLEVEQTPGISLESNLPDFIKKEAQFDFQSLTSEPENAAIDEIPLSEETEISTPSVDFTAEILQTESNAQLEGLFTSPEKPILQESPIPAAELSAQPEQPEWEPSIVEPFAEIAVPSQPEMPSQPAEDVAKFTSVEEIRQQEPVISFEKNITQPVVPIVPAKAIPVEKVFTEVAKPHPSAAPVEEIISEAPAKPVPAATPVEKIFTEIASKPLREIPVEVKPAIPQPKVIRQPRPKAAPKPVHYVEKPVQPSSASSQRRNAGSADLARAREAVTHGDIQTALRRYIKLVNSNKALDFVSNDLKDLVRKNPKNYLAWQTFGDARLRSNRIQEALDAYAKAAELLK